MSCPLKRNYRMNIKNKRKVRSQSQIYYNEAETEKNPVSSFKSTLEPHPKQQNDESWQMSCWSWMA